MSISQMTEMIQHVRRAVLLSDGAGLTDGQLLESFISRREEAALAALVRRHSPMVWGVCRRLLFNDKDAEDAFQATFLVLVRKAASVIPRDMVANWLYGVAYQTARKARGAVARRARKERQVNVMPEVEAAVVQQDLWNELLDQELNCLPDKHRAVIVLCDLEEKTRREAARQLGAAEGTVASRLVRARMMLRKRLARRGVLLSGGALAAVLSQSVASASVPTSAVSSAVKVLTLSAAGKAAQGLISAKVATLTEGVLKLMFLTKLRAVTVVLLTAGMIAAGAGTLYVQATQKQGEDRSLQQKGSEGRLLGDEGPIASAALLPGPGGSAKGEDNDAKAVLDKAIKAIGGEAMLHKATAMAWKARGKSLNNGKEYPFTNETTVQGLDQIRMEYEDEIDGNRVRGGTVLDGDKGWRKNGSEITKLDAGRLANQKRNLYLLVVPVTLVPLKEKSFRIEPAGEQRVGDRPAIGLKVTGPDGKDFNLFFDKESGLPVKLEVRMGSRGNEFTQETIFGDYQEFDGIKKATKIERWRDGQKILEQEILEFKVLDKVAPETFAEPK
jgi:RNA polymerase sigma factor (sigma-70 family)